MTMHGNLESTYNARITELNLELDGFLKKRSRIAWLRFFSIITAFVSCYLLWPISGPTIAITSLLLFFGIFLRLVVLDLRNKTKIENANTLITINKEEIRINAEQYTHRDDGIHFQPAL